MINKFFLIIFNYLISLVDLPNKLKIKKFFITKLFNHTLTVIDIGAHKGETINFFLKNFKISKIYAFEPNKDLVKKLSNKKKFKINKVELLDFGVGDKETNNFLKITIDTASSTFNEINTSSQYYIRKCRILSLFSQNKSIIKKNQETKIIKLSSFIENRKINHIDVLKIDTEGFEYNILKGIDKDDFKKINFIYFEHHFDNMISKNYKFSDINSFLRENNFEQKYKIRMSLRKSFEYIYEKKK